MRIVIAGGSGFVGSEVVRQLGAGSEIVVLSRARAEIRGVRVVEWNQREDGEWAKEIRGADVVVNLAGANIGEGRWSESRKRLLASSRIDVTRSLASVVAASGRSDQTFIQASAVGYYGDRGSESLDESSSRGSGFLADLTNEWEAEATECGASSRLVVLRLGVVIDPAGGALQKMLPPFRLGIGGPLGKGDQWWSWIDRVDLARMVGWAIQNRDVRGVYNATAPEPVTNRTFTRTLARALRRPAFLPAPAFALRLALGEMADEMLLASQRAFPRRALDQGFAFHYPTIEASLGRAFS